MRMLLPMARKRSFPYLFALSALAVLVTGTGAAYYVHERVDAAGRAHILDRASTVATLLPPADIRLLAGSEADLGAPSYEQLKRLLSGVTQANSDVRFAYLMGERADGTMFFYADSEPPSSEDYSPPGQVYDEATPAMRAIFDDGIARAEGPDKDRWGTWISAYAPVFDEQGVIVAMLGIDLPAEAFLRDLYAYTALPALIAFSVLLFLIAGELARRRERKSIDEKEEFLSIASHEIRTPLSGVRWGLEQLSRNATLPEVERPLVALMHETSVTLIARLNNLLDEHSFEHAAERTFKKDTVYVEAFMREAASTLMLAAKERGITISLPSAPDASVQADSQLLRHVFQNLIGNAIKYTKPNTTVTVTYGREDGMHVFRFKDEGEGIPEEERARIFSGYHRGENARRNGVAGTGLGLYMARKAVLMHGGTIAVDSTPGKGTTFTVRLPD